MNDGESMRVFPISNWTELDVWAYILRENIPIVPLYFAAERPVVDWQGQLIMVDDERMRIPPGQAPQTPHGPLPHARLLSADRRRSNSNATSLEAIVAEMIAARTSERGGRLIDRESSSSMEKKKREGYF